MMEVLANTPIWVYIVLVTLLLLGFWQSRARVVPSLAVILPAIILLILSLISVLSFGVTPQTVMPWLLGLTLAIVLNQYWWRAPNGVFYVMRKKRFIIPGSWWPLVVMLLIFIVKYTVGVSQSLDANWLRWQHANGLISLAYGLLGGLFLAWSLKMWQARQTHSIGLKRYRESNRMQEVGQYSYME